MVILIAIALAAISACSNAPKFSDVTGKEWQLVEVKTEPQNIKFDRDELTTDGFGTIFTLNFDAQRLSGVGAPNKYTAPYTVGKDQVITVQMAAGTMMAPINEPEKLKEQDYFTYIKNAYKWNGTKEQLELFSKNTDGAEAVLIYKLGSVKK